MQVYTYKADESTPPKQLVVLLHGLGSNGQDLISLAPYFSKAVPDAVFVSPDAPFPCDMAPVGHQWFSLRDWSKESKLSGVKETFPILSEFLNRQLETYKLPADKMALVGFSQGTMMSLYTAPNFDKPIGGVLGYSGALVWDKDTDQSSIHKVPVQLIHGDADTVVPFSALGDAKDVLDGAGFDVKTHVCKGLAHSIDEDGIRIGSEFLKTCLAA
jgi:phospholipase/carboxylesterase